MADTPPRRLRGGIVKEIMSDLEPGKTPPRHNAEAHCCCRYRAADKVRLDEVHFDTSPAHTETRLIFHAARQTPKNAKAGSRFARTAERRITAILIALSDGTRADEDDDCAADFRPGIYPARLTPPRHSACAGRFSNASTLCLSRS